MVDTVDTVVAESPEAYETMHIGFLLMPEYTLSTFAHAV